MQAKLKEKAAAASALAMGQPKAATARHAGVSASTLSRWMADTKFLAEVEAMRPIATARPLDGAAFVAAIEACERRFAREPKESRPGVVLIPAYATPAERRRLVARAIGRQVAAALDGSL